MSFPCWAPNPASCAPAAAAVPCARCGVTWVRSARSRLHAASPGAQAAGAMMPSSPPSTAPRDRKAAGASTSAAAARPVSPAAGKVSQQGAAGPPRPTWRGGLASRWRLSSACSALPAQAAVPAHGRSREISGQQRTRAMAWRVGSSRPALATSAAPTAAARRSASAATPRPHARTVRLYRPCCHAGHV
jgi:hypothetical protein